VLKRGRGRGSWKSRTMRVERGVRLRSRLVE
jgi:hypothetical protein